MSERPDNPAAFPEHPYGHFESGLTRGFRSGMTLRDWFAGQALAGRMINGFASSADGVVHARVAYKLADAMLQEREKDHG